MAQSFISHFLLAVAEKCICQSKRAECSLTSENSLFKLVLWPRAEYSKCLNTEWGIYEKRGYVVLHPKEALHSPEEESGNVDLYALEYTRACATVHARICARAHTSRRGQKKKKKGTDTTQHIVFPSSLTYPTSTRGMLSQIITGGLSLSLVAAACERAETTVGHSGGSALGGSESVSRDAGGGSGGDGGVEDLRLASYGPGNSS